jgi:D-inositol-3-phosphate glycosyltransferase
VAVADGRSGLLVGGHRAGTWASALVAALRARPALAAGAVEHARAFSWDRTTDALVAGYADAASAFRRAVFETEVAV